MSAVSADLSSWRNPPWLRDFVAEESQAWIFVLKALLAFYLAAWITMVFQLEQPSTTMVTVSIVMHPQSGTVLAKSFYRALGTCAGSLFGVLLMSAFPQQRELFLLCLSLWVALCAELNGCRRCQHHALEGVGQQSDVDELMFSITASCWLTLIGYRAVYLLWYSRRSMFASKAPVS